MDNKIRNSEKLIDYTVLKQINEHALKYDSSSNKKEFLKNVCAYEQKIILLNSIRPYDVLSYLNELDLESSRLVLSELNSFEIKKIIDLFTSEDKKSFYNSFSDLDLVNQFIKNDKNSSTFIDNLTLTRKIELIDSSKVETLQATKEIYKTLSEQEKSIVGNKITTPEAASALSYVENAIEVNESNNNLNDINSNNVNDVIDLIDEPEELNNEKDVVAQEIVDEIDEFKDEFLRANLEFLKNNYKEFENIEVDKYNLLPENLKSILDKQIEETRNKEKPENVIEYKEETVEKENETNGDNSMTTEEYDKYSIIGNNTSKVSIVTNPQKIQEFKREVENTELNQINSFKNNILKNKQENIRTL